MPVTVPDLKLIFKPEARPLREASAVLTFLVAEIYSPKKISNSIASTVSLSTFMSFFTLVIVVFISLKYFN